MQPLHYLQINHKSNLKILEPVLEMCCNNLTKKMTKMNMKCAHKFQSVCGTHIHLGSIRPHQLCQPDVLFLDFQILLSTEVATKLSHDQVALFKTFHDTAQNCAR